MFTHECTACNMGRHCWYDPDDNEGNTIPSTDECYCGRFPEWKELNLHKNLLRDMKRQITNHYMDQE